VDQTIVVIFDFAQFQEVQRGWKITSTILVINQYILTYHDIM